MTVEWIGPRGFRRCTLSRDLATAKREFAGMAPYVEYSDGGKTLGYTLNQSTPQSLAPMFAVQLRRERI